MSSVGVMRPHRACNFWKIAQSAIRGAAWIHRAGSFIRWCPEVPVRFSPMQHCKQTLPTPPSALHLDEVVRSSRAHWVKIRGSLSTAVKRSLPTAVVLRWDYFASGHGRRRRGERAHPRCEVVYQSNPSALGAWREAMI